MLSLTVLILVILMYLNTMVSFKYEIEPIGANDTICVEAATRYFKFKIDSLIEFHITTVVGFIRLFTFPSRFSTPTILERSLSRSH